MIVRVWIRTECDKSSLHRHGDLVVPRFRLVRHRRRRFRPRPDRQDRTVQIAVPQEAHRRWELRLVLGTATDYL